MQELKDFLIDFLIILSAATPKQIKTMKKNYMKPALRVVRIQQKCQILSGSVTSVESGAMAAVATAPPAHHGVAASTGTTGTNSPTQAHRGSC